MISRSTMYATALLNAWEQASSPTGKRAVVDRLVTQLKIDHAEALASEILSAVQRELARRASRSQVKVAVANSKSVTARTFSMLDTPTIEEQSALVGGFRIEREGMVVDASVHDALSQIRESLASA